MNTIQTPGSWSETKAKIKSRWSKLIDSEIDSYKDHPDRLKDQIQKTYGYSRELVEREFNEFTEKSGSSLTGLGKGSGGRGPGTVSQAV